MGAKLTKDVFLDRAKAAHGNKYDYSRVEYNGIDTRVEIVCPVHGGYFQSPYVHTRMKCGCPKCCRNYTKDIQYVSTKIKEIYGSKYTVIDESYVGMNHKMLCRCVEHGVFECRASVITSTARHICPKCRDEARSLKYATRMADIKKLRKIKTPQSYCNTHSISFPATKECYRCKREIRLLNKYKQVHGDRYTYVGFYWGSNKVPYIDAECSVHGPFRQGANNHAGGAGCASCGHLITAMKKRKGFDLYMSEFIKVHSNKYTYFPDEYVSYRTPIAIQCPRHGIFYQSIHKHVVGQGCPSCASSKGENAVHRCLLELGVHSKRQITIEGCKNVHPLKFDFGIYTQSNSLLGVIEYDGVWHCKGVNSHTDKSFEYTHMLDEIKDRFCFDNAIPLYRISGTQYPYNRYKALHAEVYRIVIAMGVEVEILDTELTYDAGDSTLEDVENIRREIFN